MSATTESLIELIIKKTNVDLSKYDSIFFDNSIRKNISHAGCKSLSEYQLLLEKSTSEIDNFLDSLQINYSEFFRNSLTYSVLEKIIFPRLFHKKESSNQREIRIWSAACATGQEAYSLAILLAEQNNSQVTFRIFATDQSDKQIEIAKKGIYSISTLNLVTLKRLDNWFLFNGKNYAIRDEIKANIEFSTFDLLNDVHMCPPSSIFGDFDIVFCANLLFYYKPEFRNEIIRKISKTLSSEGLIITGEAEKELFLQHHFEEIYPGSGILKKNNSGHKNI